MVSETQLAEWAAAERPAVHEAHLSATLPQGLKSLAEQAAEVRNCSLSRLVRVALMELIRAHHPDLLLSDEEVG